MNKTIKKWWIFIFCMICLFYLSCPVLAALGDVHTVISPLSRPEVSAVTSGTPTTYTCAFMRQTETAPANEAPAGSYLSVVTFTIPRIKDNIHR